MASHRQSGSTARITTTASFLLHFMQVLPHLQEQSWVFLRRVHTAWPLFTQPDRTPGNSERSIIYLGQAGESRSAVCTSVTRGSCQANQGVLKIWTNPFPPGRSGGGGAAWLSEKLVEIPRGHPNPVIAEPVQMVRGEPTRRHSQILDRQLPTAVNFYSTLFKGWDFESTWYLWSTMKRRK